MLQGATNYLSGIHLAHLEIQKSSKKVLERSQCAYILQWVADKLEINTSEDWKRVTQEQLKSLKGSTLLSQPGGQLPLISKFINQKASISNQPQYMSFEKQQRKNQATLHSFAQKLFPNEKVEFNYRHPDLVSCHNKIMELDVFLPSQCLALEFQGEQHFHWHFLFGSPEQQQTRDQEKRELCKQIGIRLIEIPYWWNQQLDTLASLINNQVPNISFQHSSSG